MENFNTVIEPIKKKWIYSFIVSPKTNLIDKPEWYLNNTLKIIYENIDSIEPKYKHQFIFSLIELNIIRLKKDLKVISSNLEEKQELLIHTYNEVIESTKVLHKLLGNSSAIDEKYDMLSPFGSRDLFERIVSIEWKYAEKNLKDITNSANKFDLVLNGEFLDYYKTPRCVDSFVTLITSMKQRMECFHELDCQFKFVELQCYLLKKFLSFLKSSTESSPASIAMLSDILFFTDESTIDLTKISRVLNGVNFLRLVTMEHYYIPQVTLSKLDKSLLENANKLAHDYKNLYLILVNKVVNIFDYSDCEIEEYLNFVKPKLSSLVYETVRDDLMKIYQERQTESLLGDLSLK